MVDGDDTYPAEYGKMLASSVLENQADMVVGDRLSSTYFEENKRPFHNFGNSIVRIFINSLFKSSIKDIMTGYRAFSYQFVKTFPVLSQGFEIETEMSIHAVDKNMRIENVVIEYRDRPEGSVSKLSTYSDGIRVLKTILRLYKNYRPMRFYGCIAGALTLVAMILFAPVFITWLHSGLVPRFPTLIVCSFIMIAALISFFIGLILSTIIEKDKQQFEFRLNTVNMLKKVLFRNSGEDED